MRRTPRTRTSSTSSEVYPKPVKDSQLFRNRARSDGEGWVGFKSQAARIGGEPAAKRTRVESEPPASIFAIPPIEPRTDAWSDFERMMRHDMRY